MSAKLVQKHYDFNEKDISEGKYSAWELIEPFWYMVSIYDSLEVYHREAEPLSDAQRKLLALFWYDAEVCNGGHSQFFFNSTGIVWKDAIDDICKRMDDYVKLHPAEFAVNGEYPAMQV